MLPLISSSVCLPCSSRCLAFTFRAQIQRCDGILEHMEGLLGRFQSDLGQVSDEIRTLQVRALRPVMSLLLAACHAAMRELFGQHYSATMYSGANMDGMASPQADLQTQ
jgi:hypothetical protein